jgi:protoheme IX farnesyltransferase
MTRFQKLSLITLAATLGLVAWGGFVRGTGSGLGCPDWPLCYGAALPPLEDVKAWIEWIHRAIAVVIGFLVLGLVLLAWRDHRDRRELVVGSVAALALTAFQAVLGKITVETGNSGESVTAHLATAMLLLAVLAFLAVRAHYPGRLPANGASQRFTLLAAFTAAAVYALLLFGARVTAVGASLVFPDWPLFDGRVLPDLSSDPAVASLRLAHFLHRVVAALVALVVLATAWVAWTRYDARWGAPGARGGLLALTGTAAALYAVQVVVGALQISTGLASWTVALHVALGATIWMLLAAATVYAYASARGAALDPKSGSTSLADTSASPTDRPSSTVRERVGAYVALTKPRIIELLLVTTVPAMVLAARGVPRLDLVFWTLLGGSLAAGSANAINQYLEQDVDQLMSRTRRRPLPAHAIPPENALVFGLVLGVIAFAGLAVLVNLLAAFLTLLAIAFYVVVYTLLLKRNTPQNIVIGGAAGALPPVIGWAAVTGDLSLAALLLFAIVFYWTPPHFWALSLRLAKDYKAAGIPMLPVVRGVPETTRQILLHALLMVALTLVLFAVAGMGVVYLVGATVLGALFLREAVAMWREGTDRRAMRVYKYSITYLTALFALIAVDVVVPIGF